MLQKILCPLDFSNHSRRTLDVAVNLAETFRAKLILFHVVEGVQGDEQFLILAITPQEIEERLAREANRRMQALLEEIKANIEIETAIGAGKAFVEIIKKAREENVDLIVIGSHGYSGDIPHILLGSVVEKVARKAPCSVFIVKDKNNAFRMP